MEKKYSHKQHDYWNSSWSMKYSLLLPDDGWRENICSDASMFLSNSNTQQALLPSFFPELPAHLALLLPPVKRTQNQGHKLNPPHATVYLSRLLLHTGTPADSAKVHRQLCVTAKKQWLNYRVSNLQVHRWHWHCRDTNCKTSLNSCFQCITW